MIEFITDLYAHQRAAVEKLSHTKVGALYMGMGTGKTRTALELIGRRFAKGKVSQVLWLCPYSVQKDLAEQLSEHITDTTIIKIAGIESLSSSLRIYGEISQWVNEAPTYLIIDESLLIKNPQAYRTRRIMEISKSCTYKLILNGTPIARSEGDLFSQWYVLDWRILGYQSFWSFSANHLEYDRDHPGKVIRALNTDYLARKIAPYTVDFQKADILDLPEKIYHNCEFWLTDEQEEHYSEIAEALIEQVNERKPETLYRLFGALQSITSGFAVRLAGGTSTRYTMYPPLENPRICRLLEIINDIHCEQCVIYCKYTQEINDIVTVLGNKAVAFYGEMPIKSRNESKRLFKSREAQFFVANKSCAQFGLNLQFAHIEIFYNNDFDYATKEQAEDRLHRIGQTKDVEIYNILARNTIDVTIMDCIERKCTLAEKFHDSVKQNTRTNTLLQMMGGKNAKDLHSKKRI